MTTLATTPTAEPTRISVHPGETRVRVGLVTGPLAPRLIDRGTSSATVAIAAAQMLLLDGDAVLIEIEVGPGCTLDIEDVGGTVAYPGTSSWEVRARVGAGGRLLWRGLPFVVTADGDSRRRTEIVLGPGAAALIRETLVLGRHGEIGGRIDAGLTATRTGPLLVERLVASGAFPGPGVLGTHRVIDSVIALGYRPPTVPGDLVLEQPGAVARRLGQHTHASDLDAVWAAWRATLREDDGPPSNVPSTEPWTGDRDEPADRASGRTSP
ncbi:urease accessory protein UreD [Cellulomonas sp. URHD0024]|uniref:urease accessory protein UreD n=1 Tax=Cellulomonas sp. URHD0024 TaxID=1302620 RepID=UPI00041B672D|nr:urease accessory protein UreD [Cellulomonas sp. URHD0024]